MSVEIFLDLQEATKGAILAVSLQKLVKDVCLLSLGCNQNLEIARDVGFVAGMVARSNGFEYVVFGTLDTLDESDPDPLDRVSRSAFITAQVLTYLGEGLFNSGVLPILNGSGIIDPDVVRALISRKTIYPIFVENESKIDRLRQLGYDAVYVTADGTIKGKLPRNNVKLNIDLSTVENVRRKALEGAVVILSRSEKIVNVNQPFAKSGVLIFSDEEWLIKIAKEVLDGQRPSTGRVP
ncbi:MAG TPA: hypothetical protein PLP64_08650 [Pseudothermotoga sp.]|nr:hypothetical protein [Pseudothermotoga sp.]HOK84278.1 hypothetical protein [Pseudothermotoga sp.]HPP70888.1 hypothetical protein [Pseudothermotoga sp.]